MSGTLYVVATPIGNLEDITLRALRMLREVALIAAEDTRRTAHLLARHAITTPTTSLHAHNESAKSPSIVERLKDGQDIALVSDAGTPTVSDPGGQLIRTAIAAGIRVEPIPGPSAIMAALTVAGMEGDTFTFMGFAPTKSSDRKQWFDAVVARPGIVVFFESPHRIAATMADLQRVAGDCDVAICRELTKAHENVVRGPISSAINNLSSGKGEFTVVADVPPRHAAASATFDLLAEFGELTNNDGFTRRRAVAELARRHGLPANEVYSRIEEAKRAVD